MNSLQIYQHLLSRHPANIFFGHFTDFKEQGVCSPEVNGAAVVGVECSEDVVTEVVRAAAGEDLGVHLHKLVLGQLATGAVSQEPLVPLLHTQVSSVRCQVCQVCQESL